MQKGTSVENAKGVYQWTCLVFLTLLASCSAPTAIPSAAPVAQELPTATRVLTPIWGVIDRSQSAARTATPNRPLPIPSPTATPVCAPPVATPTTAPTSASNPSLPGSLDPGFGTGGRVLANTDQGASAMAIQADGKIVIAGSGNSDLKMFNLALLRYNPDGSLDPSFGKGGIVLTGLGRDPEGADALVIQPDGKYVVAGRSSIMPGRSTLALLRFNTDGSLDQAFGNGGKAVYELTDSDAAAGVAIQADGKIVVVGNIFQPIPAAGFLVVRYNRDGSLDSTFGSGGKVITAVGVHDTVSALAIQSDGKVVVAGFTDARSKSAAVSCLVPNCIDLTSLLLLRYLP